ncbi:hypothetical protein [Aquibium microcysteis]|uniref:hypothetical protein n=1 Tax=Aquibium microcysteis TaxID=675281 RepID=UPI00165D2548|nr:hypothetical protein [Aquibium microcysteis]
MRRQWVACLAAWAALVAAPAGAAETGRSTSAFLDADQPLSCDVNLADDLDVTEIAAAPAEQLPEATRAAFLRMKILRYPAAAPEERRVGDTTYLRVFDDHLFLYHWPEEELLLELQDAMADAAPGALLREARDCSFERAGLVAFHAPFFSKASKGRLNQGTPVLHVERRIFIAADEVPAGVGAPAQAARSRDVPGRIVAVDRADGTPAVWTQNDYPWIDLAAARTVKPGDTVFAVERTTCEADGNFILGSVGVVSDGDTGAIMRQEMIASNNYYGASGDPLDASTVAGSVDDRAYWCIPKREFCYQQVPFGDFGVKAKKGETARFAPDRIYSMEQGLLPALQAAVVGACPQRIMKVRTYR